MLSPALSGRRAAGTFGRDFTAWLAAIQEQASEVGLEVESTVGNLM